MTDRRTARLAWGGGAATALTAAVAGFVLICLVRYADLPKAPWAYIGLAVAAVGAVSAIVLSVVQVRRNAIEPHDEP